MHRKFVVLFCLALIIGNLGATSIEIPICTASGDQVYPDVCWDGEAFWVVWEDNELGTIRGVRINENGELLTDKIEFMSNEPLPGDITLPVIASGSDRIAVEARAMVGINEFGENLWAVAHGEYSFEGATLHPDILLLPQPDWTVTNTTTPCLLYGKNRFYSFHTEEYQTPWDFPASAVAWGIERGIADSLSEIWRSCERGGGFHDTPPIACWNGDVFLAIFFSDEEGSSGVFLKDSLVKQNVGGDIHIGRRYDYDTFSKPKSQAITNLGTQYIFVSEASTPYNNWAVGYDVLDSTGIPIKDSATLIDSLQNVKSYQPDVATDGNTWICCWENRFANNTSHLYAIEVDTTGEILKSGYVVQKSPVDKHPAIAFGSEQYLLVWTDNQDGDFNIHGRLFDTLEVFEGIEEQPLPVNELPSIELRTNPNPFNKKMTISLPKGIRLETNTVINIYDNTGSQVQQLVIPAGKRTVTWDGKDSRGQALSSGVYFVSPEDQKLKTTKIIKQ